MTKTDKLEAHRIADELHKAHCAFIQADLPGLHPDSMMAVKLAHVIRMFDATLEPTPLSKVARMQRDHEATL
jgi:hypothetical protein